MAEGAGSRSTADVVVIGAGPAGIAAAACAAEAGLSVTVLDEGLRPGGQIWRHATRAHLPALARTWLERFDRSGARLRVGSAVVDVAAGHEVLVETRAGALRVHAEKLILATGARERFLPFPGWTLPNVVGVGGAQALLKSGASARGKRVVVAGSGPLLLPVAAALAAAGAQIAAVAEQAGPSSLLRFTAGLWRQPSRLAQAVRYRSAFVRTRYRTRTWVVRAQGEHAVEHAVLTDGRRTWRVPCDLLCVGYGLVPSTELARLLGCALRGGRVMVDAQQQTSARGVWCAGEPTGVAGVEAALLAGEIAGRAVAGRSSPEQVNRLQRQRRFAGELDRTFQLRPELRTLATPETIVCRCEDVRLETLEPMRDARMAKLHTRAGMGPCQGRVCGAALDFLFGWTGDNARVPLSPARLATFLEPTSTAATAEGEG